MLTEKDAEGCKLIGLLRNNWRERMVEVYEHPTKRDKVISIGRPYDGGKPVVCEETVEDYSRVISLYPETAIYN